MQKSIFHVDIFPRSLLFFVEIVYMRFYHQSLDDPAALIWEFLCYFYFFEQIKQNLIQSNQTFSDFSSR